MARGAAALLLILAFAGAALASPQEPPASPAERSARESELRQVQEELRLGQDRSEELRRQVEALRAERAKLSEELVAAAAAVQAQEADATAAEQRLGEVAREEERLRASLTTRRAALAGLLAAMQRIGRSPPPAILARPEDAVGAIRAALLLGSALPELRGEAEALAFSLQEVGKLQAALVAEGATRTSELAELERRRADLARLVEEKRERESAGETALAGEQTRVAQAVARAKSLEELIARMERALTAAAENLEATGATALSPARVLAAVPAMRIKPAVPFETAHGLLALPASGTLSRQFGEADGFGGVSKGLSLTTRAEAQVTAPSDGWVVYAGPFRTYGQLLIINAGGGYHLLLAGMERIDVELGQFVLTGEPVAVMGGKAPLVSPAVASDANPPTLYVEFRKDGVAVDPAPWWASKSFEKVRG